MTEKPEKNKSGAGKFILGAALGAAVGAIASKFIKLGSDDGEEIEEDTCDCGKKDCKCDKESTDKEADKKPAEKKTTAKK